MCRVTFITIPPLYFLRSLTIALSPWLLAGLYKTSLYLLVYQMVNDHHFYEPPPEGGLVLVTNRSIIFLRPPRGGLVLVTNRQGAI